MTLSTIPPRAGITLDPLSQYGSIAGLLIGGLLQALKGDKKDQPDTSNRAWSPIQNTTPQVQPSPYGDFSPRPPTSPTVNANATSNTGVGANGTGNTDALSKLASALGVGGGGLGGLGGTSDKQDNSDPMANLASAFKPATPPAPAGMLQFPNYANTGPNADLLRMYGAGNSAQPNGLGVPMGAAGINPLALFQRRLALMGYGNGGIG